MEELSVIPSVVVAPVTVKLPVIVVLLFTCSDPVANPLLTFSWFATIPKKVLLSVMPVVVVDPDTFRVLTFTAPPTMLFAFKVPNTVKFSLTLTFGATPPTKTHQLDTITVPTSVVSPFT